MNLEGRTVRLRAVEPDDIEQMYTWENDPQLWHVSGTKAPFSRHELERFIEEQQFDIFQSHQQRLVIEPLVGELAVGALDLFELDPLNRRAGVGILVHSPAERGKGYASDAIRVACRYAHEVLGLHQLWCNVGAENIPSLELFRKAGFEAVGIKRDWQWSPEGFRDEILMQKILR